MREPAAAREEPIEEGGQDGAGRGARPAAAHGRGCARQPESRRSTLDVPDGQGEVLLVQPEAGHLKERADRRGLKEERGAMILGDPPGRDPAPRPDGASNQEGLPIAGKVHGRRERRVLETHEIRPSLLRGGQREALDLLDRRSVANGNHDVALEAGREHITKSRVANRHPKAAGARPPGTPD